MKLTYMKYFIFVLVAALVFISGCTAQQNDKDDEAATQDAAMEEPVVDRAAENAEEETEAEENPEEDPEEEMESIMGFDYSEATPSTGKGTGTEASTAAAQFIDTNFIDLDRIDKISKFRGGYAHDYSEGSPEDCRSMKHYFWAKGGEPGSSHSPPWVTVKYYSPVDGRISFLRTGIDSDGETEYYFTIIPVEQSSYYLNFFHVNLLPEFRKSGSVKEGQHIGYIADEYAHAEIAVQKGGLGAAPISFFDIVTDDLFEEYKKRGVPSRDSFIISKEARDSESLECDQNTEDKRFIGRKGISESLERFRAWQSGRDNWVDLK